MAVSVLPRSLATEQVHDALKDLTQGDRDFFDNDIAILDLAHVASAPATVDWAKLAAVMASFKLKMVAVRNVPDQLRVSAIRSGLAIIANPSESTSRQANQPTATAASAPEVAHPAGRTFESAMIIDTPVRAGQRIYAVGQDLIITAVVNNGAEVIADGSIHVYAPLRGRALAGARGNTASRIFALSMEPQLVSIAGVYRTFEDGFPPNWGGSAAQVRLDDNVVHINPI